MRIRGRQLRFLLGSLAAWGSLRWAYLAWGGALVGAGLLIGVESGGLPFWSDAPAARGFTPAPAATSLSTPIAAPIAMTEPPERWVAPPHAGALLRVATGRMFAGSTGAILRRATFSAPIEATPPTAPQDRPTAIPRTSAAATRDRRWSASLYLFGRPGKAGAGLAEGGQLGGSQFALRLAYRLNAHGPTRLAAAARLYVPLGAKGAEAAGGLDWYPAPGVPVRLTVERRTGIDHFGRNAWSAYAAGGFYREALGGRLAIDGYGQAGVVGARSRDAFVDGSLRAGARLDLGRSVLNLGGGVWGAAQPDLARLDVGPRAALTVPVANRAFTLAVEGRFRIAGQAQPGSGVALTLGADL